MPPSNKRSESNQSQRFINFAREVGADQDEQKFDDALRRLNQNKTAGKGPADGGDKSGRD